jgi:hypothetical protein
VLCGDGHHCSEQKDRGRTGCCHQFHIHLLQSVSLRHAGGQSETGAMATDVPSANTK